MASAIEHQELLQVKLGKEIQKLKERKIKEDKRIYDEALQQAIGICDKYINLAKIKDLNEFQDGAISCAKTIKSELQNVQFD